MAAERPRHKTDEDPLEQTELARRLRRMQWPPAPPEVKERVLRRIVTEGRDSTADGGEQAPPDASSG